MGQHTIEHQLIAYLINRILPINTIVHLFILCFQFQQIQTEKQHQYTFDSTTVNTLYFAGYFFNKFMSH